MKKRSNEPVIKPATPEEILGDSEWFTCWEAARYFKVCEERENDPDLCSSVHGPWATNGK